MQYSPAPHVTQHWTMSKPSATGRRGIVVSQVKAAAEAGVAILNEGGNAIDAAVATALSLASAEPWNSGLGGIGYALIHRAGQARAEVVDFAPVAPAAAQPSLFKLTGRMKQDLFAWPEVEGDTNIHGPLSFVTPSAVAGYAEMLQRWGKLPLATVMAPAVALAKRGLPSDWFTAIKIGFSASVLRRYDESARIYLPNGLPPTVAYQGDVGFIHQGRLADTMEHLSRAGLRDLYEGDIAASVAADVKAMGGIVSADDLRGAKARIVPATEYQWRGRTLQLASRLTAAPTMMRVLDQMADVPYGAEPDAAWFAAFARAMKGAYAERLQGLGDGDDTCTTHLTVCDQDGTMVSMTTTLLSSMGSRVVLPGSGILMNNGMMWFDPRPDQPNSVGPGKRPLTNMSPIILCDNGRPWLAAGASGGRRILASVAQIMTFIADFGMTPDQAAHFPRIDVSGPDSVAADMRLPDSVIAALQADGPVSVVEHGVLPINFACPNVVVQAADGTRTGVSDAQSPWSAAVAQ
jgi:gamma-glutamyltranspeptidase/glutathione hydrolase